MEVLIKRRLPVNGGGSNFERPYLGQIAVTRAENGQSGEDE